MPVSVRTRAAERVVVGGFVDAAAAPGDVRGSTGSA
jgi:hypothetical protein